MEKLKKLLDELEDKCLGEDFKSDMDRDKEIAKFSNSQDGSYGLIYYDKIANITILDFYDGKYSTSIAFKEKQEPDHIIFYHLYYMVKENI